VLTTFILLLGGCFGEDTVGSVLNRDQFRSLFNAQIVGTSVVMDAGCGSGISLNLFSNGKESQPQALLLVDSSPSCIQVTTAIANSAQYEDKPVSIRCQDLNGLVEGDLHGVTHILHYPGYPPNRRLQGERERKSDTKYALLMLGNPTTTAFDTTKLTLPYLNELGDSCPALRHVLEQYTTIRISNLRQRETRLNVWMYIRHEIQVRHLLSATPTLC
jgi:hypothetical protein